ncbi:MAG: glutamine synthetase [Nitrospinota bacterium]|nr:MAG: glutamine synthetase [Nitrospinota bacterium]
MNKDDVLRAVRENDVQLVRFLYCDNVGVIRGKATHVHALASRMDSGIGLTVAMQSFATLEHIAPQGSFGPVGEIRLVPDPDTFVLLPYVPRCAAMLTDMVKLDRQPWEACPRSFLKRMVERARTEAGLTLQAAFENEFTLAIQNEESFQPLDKSLCFSSIGMDEAADYISDLIDALAQQNIQVEQYYAELGPGQQEMSISHADPLRAADNQLIFRDTARGVAKRHGLIASFAPKPFPMQAGNGCHIHFSAWDTAGEKNLFYDPHDPYLLSETAYHFIGGILTHLPALLALTTPSVNSYRRLQPRFWSSAFTCYGPDNREAAVRIVSGVWGQEPTSIHLELKSSDASQNPYIGLGGLIAAGLDGLAKRIHPGEPMLVDPATLSEAERVQRGVKRFPTTLEEAVDNLERDEVLCEAMGEVLAREYIAVKRADWADFEEQGEAFEIEHHFYRY